jgi:IMP dehydrogenase
VLLGPSCTADGTTNLFGGLRRAMAMTGYSGLKEFQKVEVMLAPAARHRDISRSVGNLAQPA